MGFELLLLIVGIAALTAGFKRLRTLEGEVARLRELVDGSVEPRVPFEIAEPTLQEVRAPRRKPLRETLPFSPRPEPLPEEPARASRTFESLIGGQLPIWVGGAALVISAFFLVRYSIESGLLGPAMRVVLAALFSLTLIALSEVARRYSKTRDDPRVAQVLAGAGTASAYGTLYIAAAQYHLVGPLAGFVLMIAITAAALWLALRHGPPTAVMALIGGFAAPLVAGFDAAGLGPLLVYLALFIAALFALAAHRGWRWLALAAVVAGFGWANLLIVLLGAEDTAGVGAFVVALAIGATLALPRTGATAGWLRAAPLVGGLVQLLVLAPTLDFGPIAWTFHLVLAAAALVLARRDPALEPAALAAAALVTVLVAAGLIAPERDVTPIAAVAATALFAGTGFAFSRRAPMWAAVALVGLAGPVLAAHVVAPELVPQAIWTLFELAAAAVAAAIAWRHRDRIDVRDVGLVGGTATAALLAGAGVTTAADWAWAALATVPVLLALGAWAHRIHDRDLARLPTLVLFVIAVLAFPILFEWLDLMRQSIGGAHLTYPLLPPLVDVARTVAAPALAAAALFAWPRSYGAARPRVAGALAVVAAACLYTLAKQPLAIATEIAFLMRGFTERAAITLAFAGIGWALATRTRFARTGAALLILAIARFAWFDLALLNPAAVTQQVGALPLLNTAVLLPTLLALATWRVGASLRWRWATLALTLVAVVAAVRQVAHGTLLTGPVGSGETWGYSAALLLLASAWLWRGLVTRQRYLRIAALALLTLVTIKVFLLDVAALGGLLRILSFLGLGLALIGIGWAYNRLIAKSEAPNHAAHPSP